MDKTNDTVLEEKHAISLRATRGICTILGKFHYPKNSSLQCRLSDYQERHHQKKEDDILSHAQSSLPLQAYHKMFKYKKQIKGVFQSVALTFR